MIGVYEIVCQPTGRRYVGSTSWSFVKRWAKHRRDLAAGKHHSSRLQRAWAKHGADAFEFRVIELCRADAVVAREQVWLDQLKPEFNTAKIAYSCRGVVRTPEQRERYSAAAKRRHAEGRGATHGLALAVQSEEHKARARAHARSLAPKAAAARREHAAKRRAV